MLQGDSQGQGWTEGCGSGWGAGREEDTAVGTMGRFICSRGQQWTSSLKFKSVCLDKKRKGKEPARIGGCTANCQRVFVKRLLSDSKVVRGV